MPMMKKIASLRSGDIILQSGLGARWVELPYQGNEYAMVVLLPQQRHQLDAVLKTMTTSDFSGILNGLDESYKKLVHLSMPKFTIRSTFSLVNVLLNVS